MVLLGTHSSRLFGCFTGCILKYQEQSTWYWFVSISALTRDRKLFFGGLGATVVVEALIPLEPRVLIGPEANRAGYPVADTHELTTLKGTG